LEKFPQEKRKEKKRKEKTTTIMLLPHFLPGVGGVI
jgi:hypothetical protein